MRGNRLAGLLLLVVLLTGLFLFGLPKHFPTRSACPPPECSVLDDPVDQGCAAYGCPVCTRRICECAQLVPTYDDGCWSCSCEPDNSCGTDCDGGGSCTATNPGIPTLDTPANGATFVAGSSVPLDWNVISSWGEECSGSETREYRVCAGTSSAHPCYGTSEEVDSTTSDYSYTQSLADTYYWQVKAKNKAGNWGGWSTQRNFLIVPPPCNTACSATIPCATPLVCHTTASGRKCRNTICKTETDCVCPTPTPLPLPECDNWTSIYINDCSKAEYDATPRSSDCITQTRDVTLHLSSSNASKMGFANVGTLTNCDSIDDGDFSGPYTYADSRSWYVSTGDGQKKVCAIFTNATGGNKCGARIQYAAPTSTPTPTPTPTPIPTPTPCPVPPVPTGLSCNITAGNVSWDAVSGADHYPFRIDDQSNGWTGTCSSINSGDVCEDVYGTSRSYTFGIGGTYHAWVHTINTCGNWSSGAAEIFCNGPTPTPTPTPCPVPSVPTGLSCNLAAGNFSWDAVSGAHHYPFRIDDQSNGWTGTCSSINPGDVCEDVYGTSRSYTFGIGRTYHAWVHTINTCGNWSSGAAEIYCTAPSCSVSGPTFGVIVNDNVSYCVTPSNAPLGAEIWKSLATSQSWTNVRSTTVGYGCSSTSFNQPGNYYIVCNAYGLGGGQCSGNPWCPCSGWFDCGANDVLVVNVINPQPWWQVVDGDIQTNGNLYSDVPPSLYFGLPGLGGFPGVAKYGGSTSLSSANVSAKGWLANSSYSPPNGFQNYSYFRRMIPEDVTLNPISLFPSGGTASNGYYWYEYTGGASFRIMSPIDLAGRKVVLLVTGTDLSIESNIKYTPGNGIFVALVDGNINIDPTVGGAADPNFDLMGFFLANNISTGDSAKSLRVKGSVAALVGLNLQRNLGASLNLTKASEVFEYDPASAFLFPPKLSIEKTRWKEVAP